MVIYYEKHRGNLKYSPPELLVNNKNDIWSLGALILDLAAKQRIEREMRLFNKE